MAASGADDAADASAAATMASTVSGVCRAWHWKRIWAAAPRRSSHGRDAGGGHQPRADKKRGSKQGRDKGLGETRQSTAADRTDATRARGGDPTRARAGPHPPPAAMTDA